MNTLYHAGEYKFIKVCNAKTLSNAKDRAIEYSHKEIGLASNEIHEYLWNGKLFSISYEVQIKDLK
jgi:hypothetical protein